MSRVAEAMPAGLRVTPDRSLDPSSETQARLQAGPHEGLGTRRPETRNRLQLVSISDVDTHVKNF